MMTCDWPSTDEERSSSMPLMVLTAPSMLLVISVSICSGEAPGLVDRAPTTVGTSMFGQRSTPSVMNENPPTTVSDRMSIVAKTGRRTQISASFCISQVPSCKFRVPSSKLKARVLNFEPATWNLELLQLSLARLHARAFVELLLIVDGDLLVGRHAREDLNPAVLLVAYLHDLQVRRAVLDREDAVEFVFWSCMTAALGT